MAELSKNLKDAGYVGIGLGVIAFQRAQVFRVDLEKQLKAQLGDTRAQVAKGREAVEAQVQKASALVESPTKLVTGQLGALEQRAKAAREQLAGRVPGLA